MEREQLHVDVLFVGGGPANLAAAYRLARNLADRGSDARITVLHRTRDVSDDFASGTLIDPRALVELFGAGWHKDCPVQAQIVKEQVFYFTEASAIGFPITPPALRNHGLWLVDLDEVRGWLRGKLAELGVEILEGVEASALVLDGASVKGVETADDRMISAKVTVLGEGAEGPLTDGLIDTLSLDGTHPRLCATAVKEVWEIPGDRVLPGEIWHAAGWPLAGEHFGGSWMYASSDRKVSLGLVATRTDIDPDFDHLVAMQTWKQHPKVRELLDGGTLVCAGTQAIPEGGFWSRPRCFGDGFLIVGDGASVFNSARFKGVHTAMKSGMLAADVLSDALSEDDFSATRLSLYEQLFENSWLHDELHLARNHRASFSNGFWWGGFVSTLSMAFGGRLLRERIPLEVESVGHHGPTA